MRAGLVLCAGETDALPSIFLVRNSGALCGHNELLIGSSTLIGIRTMLAGLRVFPIFAALKSWLTGVLQVRKIALKSELLQALLARGGLRASLMPRIT